MPLTLIVLPTLLLTLQRQVEQLSITASFRFHQRVARSLSVVGPKLHIYKDWNIFLKFLGEVARLIFKYNLSIILCSKSEKFFNVEALKKIRYS